MNIGKTIRKFRRNTRAISPVIATLLMIAIAVVASLVAYAWVMGYMNFTTEKTGKSILIQSVTYDGNDATDNDKFTVYIQNVGDSAVQFPALNVGSGVYVENVQADVTSIKVDGAEALTLVDEKTAVMQLTATGIPDGVQQITIKVTALDGTQMEITKQFTII
jgi:flagellin-like protein